MITSDDDELEKAKKALDRVNSPGYFKVLAALAKARRVPSNQLAKAVEAKVGEIEKIKAEYLKELNATNEHASDIEKFSDSLSKIRFEDMKHELLDHVKRDLITGAMDAKTKVALLQFLHGETKKVEKKGTGKGIDGELTEAEFNERLERLQKNR